MGRSAGFDADQASREFSEERKELRASNLPSDHNGSTLIDAVHLEHRLRDVQPDRDRLAHALSSISARAYRSRGGGEPSTAST